jgi:hypothetical protein
MGILQFYSYFKQTFADAITHDLKKYDAVAFDLNQWIHMNIVRLHYNVNIMADECLDYINMWSSNAHTIVVVMDGPSPPPKLEEQKKRRSILSPEKLVVSVGTLFMEQFHCALEKRLYRVARRKTVYYSSHNVKGEGEHKAVDLLLLLQLKTLFVSIDADSILLCILNKLINVDIVRIYKEKNDFISIKKVLEQLPVTPYTYFVNVCFLGNDYLPRIKTKMDRFENITNNILQIGKNHQISLCDIDVENCKNYLTYLHWVILYYTKPYDEKKIPNCSMPKKLKFCILEQYCYNNNNFLPQLRDVQEHELTVEYQSAYVMPNQCCEMAKNQITQKCIKLYSL